TEDRMSTAAPCASGSASPNPQNARPQSPLNEYRQAETSASVRQTARQPQIIFSRPRPISIAPNAPAADGNSSRARITIVTASTGPMNAAHGMGEAAVLSSASNSCMYGSAPTAAARPATTPPGPTRSSELGPASRERT